MNWKKYLPWIGIALFVYILLKIDLQGVLSEIIHANPVFIFVSLIFLIFMFVAQTLKWFVIALKQGIRIPFKESFKINLITHFYGFITPSKLGSAIRADYLKKYSNNSYGKGLCNFILDKLLDVASLAFMAVLSSIILSIKYKDELSLPTELFIGLFIAIVLFMILFINKKRSKVLLRIFYRKVVPNKLKEKAKLTFDAFYDKMPKKRYFIMFFFMNLVTWIITYSATFFIGQALGINLPFIYFLAILPIGTLISLLPITINGLGTREATLIKLFAIFGIGAEKVFSMSILSLLILGILPAIIAGFFIFKRRE